MPETIAMLVWIVGGAVIVALLAIVAFFIVRLINGIDAFKDAVTAEIKGLGKAITAVHADVTEQVGGLRTRVTVLEEAGCEPCRERLKNG